MDDEDTGSNSSSPVPGDGEASPLFEKKKISYHSLDIRDTETVSAASTTLTLPEFRPTPDEVLFRMKYGHLNKGVDWIDYIENTAGPEETKWSLQLKIRDHLRDQPLSMAEKMMLQRYLQHQEVLKAVTTKQKRTEHHERSRYRYQTGFGLWENNITHIAGYFGSNVVSFFIFLRFLFYLNCFIGIIMFGFVSIPQILPNDSDIPSAITGYFGEISTSVLFYGAYNDNNWGYYERPMAYLLTWISVNIISFMVIVASMYLGYRRSKMEDQGDEFRFAWRALSSWDYTVTDKSGVLVRKAAIRTDFKEMVREEKANETRDRQELIWIYITRVIANLLVIIILGGSGYVIYVVADTTLTPEEVPDFLQDLFSKYQLPVAVSGLKVIVPPMLHFLCKLERWHPRIEIKLNIIRTALFYLASLVVFVTSLYDVSSKCVSGDQNGTFTHRNLSDFCCWENEVGEEIFKVVILDLVVVILVGLVLDVLTAIIVQCHIWNKFGYREFDVTSNVLDLIYSQSLIWLGLYFSPFLAFIQVIKLVITFYVRYIIARYCNTPPTKVFKASRTGTFYMFILLINLFVALFPMTYSVIVLSPSFDCGPFRLENHVYEVITTRIGNLPVWLQDGLNYVSTSTVIIPLVILLLLAVLYYRTKTSLYQNLITELRNQLKFERRVEKRKVFRKAKVSQGISSASGLDRIGTGVSGM